MPEVKLFDNAESICNVKISFNLLIRSHMRRSIEVKSGAVIELIDEKDQGSKSCNTVPLTLLYSYIHPRWKEYDKC
jgi:hypothetical protein